ncbi:MAG TPA: MGMT family protein [Rhodanobacteraceae bacterium]|nr:MGMT family protein [Rhodanobacteraceae bacterium]
MHAPIDPRHQRIYAAIAAIPPGRVASYGQIAARAGLPGRARLVGTALRGTPAGLNLPWFRVLHADGSIALPRGSRGFREQSQRLRAEGVEVRNGRVAMAAFGLDHDLDRALWGLDWAWSGRGQGW